MENSYGQYGVELVPFGPYKLPKKSYQYHIGNFQTAADCPNSANNPAERCDSSVPGNDPEKADYNFFTAAAKAFEENVPAEVRATFTNRYYVSAHGCGMTGEYPHLHHRMDFADAGYDGVIEPGMTLCVESYIGEEGGSEGVKLEEQCLVTDRRLERLSRFPFEDRLL